MKRKITLLLLSTMFITGAMAQNTALIYKASVAPVIDGQVDEVWAEAEAAHNVNLDGSAAPATLGEPGETTWQGLYTDEGLFILLRVADDEFTPWYVTGGESWEADKPELYLDVNYVLADGIGPSGNAGHYQVAPKFLDGMNDGTALLCGFNGTEGDLVEYAFLVDDPTYVAEYFVSFAGLLDKDGFGVDITADIGFDITVIDRDAGDTENRNAVWNNIDAVNSSWVNMDNAGIINFDGAEAGTYIDDITLAGGAIDENNGKLQLEAVITPENASNKNILWTVVNGTGRASVDKNGVVSGLMDGDVTITASSTDGSYAEGSAVVSISNQLVSMHEINMIRNGYFEELNEDGSPMEWNESGDGGAVTEGVYSVLPVQGPDGNIWDFRMQQQGGWGLNTEDMYTLSFKLWSEDSDTLNVNFEDARDAVAYNRYGESSNILSAAGDSEWTIVTELEATKYVVDVQFTELVPESNEQFQFMLGQFDYMVYMDSIVLVNDNDLALITDYTAVESITLSGETTVEVGASIQLTAAVLPQDALLTDVNWSVVNGTGWATIDASGMLTADSSGVVTVLASAKDDSQVEAAWDVLVAFPVGVSQKTVNALKVYPNPAVNELNIVLASERSTVGIYNSVGQKMNEIVVLGTEHRIDISSYPAGVYFVKAGNSTAKFIK